MKVKLLSYCFLLSAIISCADNPSIPSQGSDTSSDAITATDTNAPVVCGSGVPGAGSSCLGSTSDGDSCGQIPIANYRIKLAGLQSWYPQKSTSLIYPQKSETELRFKSDGRLRARVKVNLQPEPFAGIDSNGNQIHTCEGRISGADNPGAHRYERISFDVQFYTTRLVGSTWVRNQLLQSTHLTGIEVGACSQIVDLPAEKIQTSANPIIVEITQVSSDLFCEIQGIHCPSERIMRPQECYDITLQVANDISDDFR